MDWIRRTTVEPHALLRHSPSVPSAQSVVLPVRQVGRAIEVKSPFAPFVPFCGQSPLVAALPRRVCAFKSCPRFGSPRIQTLLLPLLTLALLGPCAGESL